MAMAGRSFPVDAYISVCGKMVYITATVASFPRTATPTRVSSKMAITMAKANRTYKVAVSTSDTSRKDLSMAKATFNGMTVAFTKESSRMTAWTVTAPTSGQIELCIPVTG